MKKYPAYFAILSTILLASFGASLAWAKDNSPTLEEQVKQEILAAPRESFFTLTVENDSLGAGTDKDYTSGVRLSYTNFGITSRNLASTLNGIIPLFPINNTTTSTVSLGHNLYTPTDITQSVQQPYTRPWAAFLYSSFGLSTLSGNHVDDLELVIGVIGPWAQGEEIQKFVHQTLHVNEPAGWDNQLHNEVGGILSWRHRWPEFISKRIGSLSFSVEPNYGASVGNIYTFAESGFTMRLSPTLGRWQDVPLLVKPSIPGGGIFQPVKKGVGWFFFSGVQGRAVAHNIFLDGNTVADSYSVDKRPLVLDANAGIALTLGNTRVTYSAVYRTKEFYGQDGADLFGAVSLSYRF